MNQERFALRLSVVGALFFAALGIVFGAITGSNAIGLDGVFSLVAFAVGLATLKVSTIVQRAPDERFHFGYAWFGPLLNTGKGLLTFGVVAIAATGAITALAEGGNSIALDWAVLYAGIATIGGIALALALRRYARVTGSPLVEVDARGATIDAVMSGAVAATLLAAFMLRDGPWSHWIPLVDPLLVLVLVLAVIRLPYVTVRDGLRELLNVAPSDALQREVRSRFEAATRDDGFRETHLRMIRVGRRFYVMACVVVPEDFGTRSVGDLDAIRERVTRATRGDDEGLLMDMFFTADSKWAA